MMMLIAQCVLGVTVGVLLSIGLILLAILAVIIPLALLGGVLTYLEKGK